MFNVVLATNFSSRTAALLAAEAGDGIGADCVILRSIDREISAPADPNRVVSVDIFWADVNGNQKGDARTTYVRDTAEPDDVRLRRRFALTVPYRPTADGYPVDERCNVIKGCDSITDGFTHPGLDTVGVAVTYIHAWKTPLDNFLRTGGTRIHGGANQCHAHGAGPVTGPVRAPARLGRSVGTGRRGVGQSLVEFALILPSS